MKRTTLIITGGLFLTGLFVAPGCDEKKKEDEAAVKLSSALANLGKEMEKELKKEADKQAKPIEKDVADLDLANATDEEIGEKSIELLEKIAEATTGNKSCDEVAKAWTGIFDGNAKLMEKMREVNKRQTRAQKKAFSKKHKKRNEAVMGKMAPVLSRCGKSEAMKKAVSRLKL